MSNATTRRNFIGGAVTVPAALVATVAACSAPTPVPAHGVSADLLRLIERAKATEEAANAHAHGPLNEAETCPDAATELVSRLVAENDALWDECCVARDEVAGFVVRSPADLAHKLTFMVKHQMGDGVDWLPELLADARALANVED